MKRSHLLTLLALSVAASAVPSPVYASEDHLRIEVSEQDLTPVVLDVEAGEEIKVSLHYENEDESYAPRDWYIEFGDGTRESYGAPDHGGSLNYVRHKPSNELPAVARQPMNPGVPNESSRIFDFAGTWRHTYTEPGLYTISAVVRAEQLTLCLDPSCAPHISRVEAEIQVLVS